MYTLLAINRLNRKNRSNLLKTIAFEALCTSLHPLEMSRFMPESALLKLYNFWYTHGAALQSANGVGTSKYDLVQKMLRLHQDIVAIRQQSDAASLNSIQKKIGDILQLQRMHVMQFRSCLDEFNRYLAALGRLESFLQHREWKTQ